MRQFKIVVAVALAIILQTVLPTVWQPFVFVNLPLIVVVYFALQRDMIEALIIGAATGIAADAFSQSLLGAGGFSKTLVAFAIALLAQKVNLDNPLLKIPVLAGAVLVSESVQVGLNKLLGQTTNSPFIVRLSYTMIGTMIAGTILLFVIDQFFSERALLRRQFAQRRRLARRNAFSFNKKNLRFGKRR
jgi:rod shape-determining protein MreD